MTSIRLPEEMENRLTRLAEITHRPKSFYIREAIKQYLENMEDYYIALERVADPKRKLLTTEDVLKDLDDDV